MHQSSFEKMANFKNGHLDRYRGRPLKIFDLGSQDVNGSYRPIFDDPAWQYIGADLGPGKNVDIVLKDPYRWKHIRSNSMDVVISGQAFEHIEFFWLSMLEIARILRPGGIVCIIAPSTGPEHRHPVDCWRFYADGMNALAKFAKLNVIEAHTEWNPKEYPDGCQIWKDSVMIASKPKINLYHRVLNFAYAALLRRTALHH